jgi:DNA-binding SARP family transcriptional activator
MPDIRIGLFGGFRVEVDRRAIPEEAWRQRKPAAAVKLLALAPRHKLHREQMMDALWPELQPAAAAANLRKALHHARRLAESTTGESLIESTGELVALSAEGLWVDVDEFRSTADRARRSGDPDVYVEAIELYREGLLPDDRYEDWAIGPRDDLQLEYVALLEEEAALLESRGDVAGATRAVNLLIAADPLREEAHVRLMRLYALAGRRADAMREYEHLREALGREPGPEAQRLYEEVRARQTSEPELTSELWERVGDLRVGSGDVTGAVAAFHLAIESADSSDAIARLHRKAAGAWLAQHDAAGAEEELLAAEGLASDPAEHARLVLLRANQAWALGELDRAEELAREARSLAEAHGEPEDVAAVEETFAIISHMRGEWRRGLQREIELASAGPPSLARVFDIHHCIGQYHLYGDALAGDVEDYARETLALAERNDAARAQAFAWCLLGESLLLHARWDEAAGCLERSCELHASFDGSRSGALPWQRLAELSVSRGEPGEADALLRRASAIAAVSPMALHMWGRIHATSAFAHLEQDDPEAAARSVRAAAASAVRYGDCPSCSALLNPLAAEAFGALGELETARAHAEAATSVASMFESSAWSAMAASAAGSVALAEGTPAEARTRFEEAASLYDRIGHVYWAERSRAQASMV